MTNDDRTIYGVKAGPELAIRSDFGHTSFVSLIKKKFGKN